MCRSVPSEFDIISTGASAGPSTSTLIGQGCFGSAFDWITGILVSPVGCRDFVSQRSASRHARLGGGDESLDESLRYALIGQRLKQPRHLARIHQQGDALVL